MLVDIFSSGKFNVFHLFFAFRLKMSVRFDNQQTTGALFFGGRGADYFGTAYTV